MNVHKSKRIRKGTLLKVYPFGVFGVISKPSCYCDIFSEKWGHVCCVISLLSAGDEEEIRLAKKRKEFIYWDSTGFPNIYVKNKRITLAAMKKGLRMLEKDERNRFRYKLIHKNFAEL